MRCSTLLGVAVCAKAFASSTTSLADKDEAELICHTDNPAECYPKIFQPTKEFQAVQPDQDLPVGLHVRLNIQTGEKEAKFNDPSEKVSGLDGIPVDRAVVVVDPEPARDLPDQHIRAGAPAYEPVGKVKEQAGPEAEEFQHALAQVKETPRGNGTDLDDALEKLNELSHDMYYGSSIAKDIDALRTLLCLMSTEDVFFRGAGSTLIPRALSAAGIISATLQNNPVALQAFERHWPELVSTLCSSDGKQASLGNLVFTNIQPDRGVLAATGRDPGPALVKAKLSAVNGLIKSRQILRHFLDRDGMQEILRVLMIRDLEYNDAQVRAANLVTDTFLDQEMGAVTGVWPTQAYSSDGQCEGQNPDLSDGCWEYQVQKVADERGSEPDHWSDRLLRMLREARTQDREPAHGQTRDEL